MTKPTNKPKWINRLKEETFTLGSHVCDKCHEVSNVDGDFKSVYDINDFINSLLKEVIESSYNHGYQDGEIYKETITLKELLSKWTY